jgi:PTS system galactitol-specific IIC component
MNFLQQFADVFKIFIDTFGVTVLVPTVIFILSISIGVAARKALRAAIFMAIGLTAFSIILGILWGQLDGVMVAISANVGKTFDVVDIGWPAAAAIVYSNSLGMLYFIIGLAFNLFLYFIKVTDTFQPTDIWNNYYFVVWGIMVQFITDSFALALFACLFMNMFMLLVADFLAPALQEYYGYQGLTNTCNCTTNISILAGAIRWLFKKFNVKELHWEPTKIQDRLGFFGEPAMVGIMMGLLMGIIAYFKDLGTLATWAKILSFALTLAAMLVIYPTVSGMFVKGLIPVSQAMNARMRSGKTHRKIFNIGIDPAVYFGETATLTSGLLLIPVLVLTAVLLPGNRTIPMADIPAMPFMAIGAVAVFKGNIFNTVLTGTIWYSAVHYMVSDTAEVFTQMALRAGTTLQAGQTFIHSWCVAAQPPLYLIMKCFTAEGSTRYILIAACAAVYAAALWHFKTHRKAWFMFFGASDEYVELYLNAATTEGD